jgi:hypothetical protein
MAGRTGLTNEKSRNRWCQIGISACVLLLPPIAIGAAATAMLAPRHDNAARDAAPAAQSIAIGVAAEAAPAFERDATLAQPNLPEPAGPAAGPRAGVGNGGAGLTAGQQKDAPQTVGQRRRAAVTGAALPAVPPSATEKHAAAPAPSGAGTYSLASAGQEPGSQAPQAQAGKDMARLMVPVHVTVVVPPNADHGESTPTEPPAGEVPSPLPATPAELPPVPPVLPALLAALPPIPHERPARVAGDVSAEAPTARSSHLASHTAIVRQPPHRNPVRGETHGARSSPQPPHPLEALRNWLESARQAPTRRAAGLTR